MRDMSDYVNGSVAKNTNYNFLISIQLSILIYIIKENGIVQMISLSEKLHEKVIRQAVPDVTDEEVYRVIRYWPSINPYYYPEILDEIWLNCLKEDDADVPLECIQKEISKEYESCVTQAINCVDPIRAVVIFSLCDEI